MMPRQFIVLDGGAIQNLFESGQEAAWNLLLSGDRQIIVSEVILEELQGAPQNLAGKFKTWMTVNGVQTVNFTPPGIRDLDGNLIKEAGDLTLLALLDRADNPAASAALEASGIDVTGQFRLLSDDRDFRGQGFPGTVYLFDAAPAGR